MADRWTPETPWFGGDKKTQAVWPTYVCRNKSCKSYGKSHPNCHCGAPSFSAQSRALEYAKGGEVQPFFCSNDSLHDSNCEYWSEGGQIPSPDKKPPLDPKNDDPGSTMGHAAIQHGLVGLLSGSLGDSYVKEKEKAGKTIDDIKENYRSHSRSAPADGLEEHKSGDSVSRSIANSIHNKDVSGISEVIHGHPLVGQTNKSHLEPILQRLAQPLLEKETHPEAFRSAVDYLDSAATGNKKLISACSDVFAPHTESSHLEHMARESSRNEVKDLLLRFKANPEEAIGMGGNLGHYLPEHAGELGATASTAMNYLDSIKPKRVQGSPLDPVSAENPLETDNYHRQLDIANNPLLALDHIKSGSLMPQDMVTIKTIYPGLYTSMISKLNDELIKAKSDGKEIPYKKRLSMSLALGQPLDSTMTQKSMMSIIQSQLIAPEQAQKQPTAQTQKTVSKTNELYQTGLDKLETKKD